MEAARREGLSDLLMRFKKSVAQDDADEEHSSTLRTMDETPGRGTPSSVGAMAGGGLHTSPRPRSPLRASPYQVD